MTLAESSFEEFNRKNPCSGCPAPCCQMQLIPHRTPATFMDVDFMHYMLQFPRTEVVVTINGGWNIIKWEQCRAFDADTFTCTLHDTPDKPRTCAMYNPYNCWYKRSFVLDEPQQVYRLDIERFKIWVTEIQFAEDGSIISAPNFERAVEILKGMPIDNYMRIPPANAVASGPSFEYTGERCAPETATAE